MEDLKAVIDELIEKGGWTQVRIAERIDCAQSTISDIQNGKLKHGPSWVIGKALIELHAEIFGRQAA